jgi:hypothetical protein
VLELIPSRVSAISCLASAEALGELAAPAGTYLCWIADDEVMLIAEPDAAQELAKEVRRVLSGVDNDAVVVDVSDGWSAFTLAGDGARDVLQHVSELQLSGDGYVQGDVAHVPVRLIALGTRLHLLVPAMWEEHLRARIRNAAARFDLRIEPAADWGLA